MSGNYNKLSSFFFNLSIRLKEPYHCNLDLIPRYIIMHDNVATCNVIFHILPFVKMEKQHLFFVPELDFLEHVNNLSLDAFSFNSTFDLLYPRLFGKILKIIPMQNVG